MHRLHASLLVAAFCCPSLALAQEDVPEGHSVHGAVFNEGPRQKAYLMEGMNEQVTIPVSTENAEVRAFVNQGVVQLHGFWYFEAERSFRQAAAMEPELAIAYWGMAMANVDNPSRARGFAWEAYSRREAASDWERRHIEAIARFYDAEEEPEKPEAEEGEELPVGAVAPWDGPKRRSREDGQRRQRYIDDLEALIYEYPEDVETKAFLVNQLWLDQRAGRRILSQQANQALLEQIFAAQEYHPSHHYAVHLWDQRDNAHRVRVNASKIGHSAPGIAHMWHMGGHIWARLDRHGDAAWQQEASARTDHNHMMRDWVIPDQIHNYAHNNEWLSRSLRHVGRVQDSVDLAKNMIELPRHPNYNMRDGGYNSATYGRRRLIETLTLYERWEEIDRLLDTMYLEPGTSVEHRAEHASLRTLARYYRGTGDSFDKEKRLLADLLDEARQERATAVDEAEEAALDAGKEGEELDEAIDDARKGATRLVTKVRSMGRLARGLSAARTEDWELALELLEESSMHPVLLSRMQLAAGKTEAALETAEDAAKDAGKAPPLANLVHVLWETGARDEAAEKFGELRAFSSDFEMDERPFQRLAPIAAELGHGQDWRIAYTRPEDIGERPELDRLGPFRWAPMQAPEWRLPVPGGQEIALSDYRGKPVLVVFFLGFGCVHCVEQLQALGPVAERFQQAGIEIVTVGTDPVDTSAEAALEEPYPFPIAGDPERNVFRQWRCFDDFEEAALHGTFLVDGKGRIRWIDISYEPFMDVEFLLEESQRLLALPVPGDELVEASARRGGER